VSSVGDAIGGGGGVSVLFSCLGKVFPDFSPLMLVSFKQ
jgi:hypothetical protein